MKSLSVAVVIPIYAKEPDENEIRSLRQCFKILNNYPFIFFCPSSLDTAFYSELAEKSGLSDVAFYRFADNYFKGPNTYNLLLLRKEFYLKFKEFDYILIYQPDAWVFSDELQEWCGRGYDYIGPPWFTGQDQSTSESGFMEYSGNGGFSLRKISSFLKVLNTYKILKSPAEIMKEYSHLGLLQRLIRVPLMLLRMLGWRNNAIYARNIPTINEDFYWANTAREISRDFYVAKAEDAVGFGFECQPARLFEINKRRLPFGCHAWLKYDYNFWKPFIG